MGVRIDVRRGLKELSRDFDAFRQKQLPFAASMALTSVANLVKDAETKALEETFDKPTPFTMRAFGVKPARKSNLVATVYARDIQAKYLEPYADSGSGMQVLGDKKGILAPKAIPLNAYGNIPKGKLAALKGRPDIFIGQITTKDRRVVNGVWQRPTPTPAKGQKGGKGSRLANRTGKLKLLIQFEDPRPVKPRLHYGPRAEDVVRKHLIPEFKAALDRAMATAR